MSTPQAEKSCEILSRWVRCDAIVVAGHQSGPFTGWVGTGPIFGEYGRLASPTLAENLDLSPFGGQRGEILSLGGDDDGAAKIGTVPREPLPNRTLANPGRRPSKARKRYLTTVRGVALITDYTESGPASAKLMKKRPSSFMPHCQMSGTPAGVFLQFS